MIDAPRAKAKSACKALNYPRIDESEDKIAALRLVRKKLAPAAQKSREAADSDARYEGLADAYEALVAGVTEAIDILTGYREGRLSLFELSDRLSAAKVEQEPVRSQCLKLFPHDEGATVERGTEH